ncbi:MULTISPECIES: hypothetical protein [unclassified Variovorax]|uniref:hypothetical protein n=1 Tax=unclassified Variovorax TaxID=663243 RepID=UPI003ECCA26E
MTDISPSETDEEFRERVVASLERNDAVTRPERAERHIWLSQHYVRVGVYLERTETSRVLEEARTSYIHGNNIATLVLALAYVEHMLNDALPPVPEPEPGQKKKRSPQITDAIEQARAARLFPDNLLDGAKILSDFRNPFIHRRDGGDPDTLGARIVSRRTHPTTILEQDAKDALEIMYAFFRHSLRPWP